MPIKRKKTGNTGTSIAKKIVADLTGLTRRKVVDLNEIRNAKIIAEDLDKTIVSKEDMSRLDPVHAVYIYGQNKMSVLVEQLAPLPAVAKLSAACADADESLDPFVFFLLVRFRSLYWEQEGVVRHDHHRDLQGPQC